MHCTQRHPRLHPWAPLSLSTGHPGLYSQPQLSTCHSLMCPAQSHHCTRTGGILSASISSLIRLAYNLICKVHFTSPPGSSLPHKTLNKSLCTDTHFTLKNMHTDTVLQSYVDKTRDTQYHTCTQTHIHTNTDILLLSFCHSVIEYFFTESF